MLSSLRPLVSRVLPNVSPALTQLREISARTKESHYETELVSGNFDNNNNVVAAVSKFNGQSFTSSVEPKITGYVPNEPYSRIKYVFASLGRPLKLEGLKNTIRLTEREDGVVQAEVIDHKR